MDKWNLELGDNYIVLENFTASVELTGDLLADPVNGYLRP